MNTAACALLWDGEKILLGKRSSDRAAPNSLLANIQGELKYTIVRGDTLSAIALRYGVSSKLLRSRNKLSSDKIRVGQTIVIPTGG